MVYNLQQANYQWKKFHPRASCKL